MSIEIKDNTKAVLSALEKAKRNGLKAIGITAEAHAKKNTPVDTGRLRNSITFAVSGESANISSYSGDNGEEGGSYSGAAPNDKDKSVYIGTNVEYAQFVELGSRGRQGVHFLQKAATEHKGEYKKLLEDAMKSQE
jgi:HK97 gp10 family phage protein